MSGAAISAQLESSLQELLKIDVVTELDSTSAWLRKLAAVESVHGRVCLAEAQQQGRGRRGNVWIASPYRNLMLSVGWEYAAWPPAVTALSLAVGVAVARALRSVDVPGVGLKWPNDILWRDRKLGGILIDVSGESSAGCTLIIGLGINVRVATAQARQIDQPWVDTAEILGAAVDRNRLAAACLREIGATCVAFPEGGDDWRSEWDHLHVLAGREVSVRGDRFRISGVVLGVDESGALLLDGADGCRHRFTHGEVSVRRR